MGNQGFQGEATSPRFSLLRARKGIKLLSLISTQPNKWVTTRTCIIGKPKKGYRYHTQRNLTVGKKKVAYFFSERAASRCSKAGLYKVSLNIS